MADMYRRVADGAIVDGSEALDARGAIRSGYGPAGMAKPGDYIGFNMALLDSAPGSGGGRVFLRDTMLTDAETTFRDSVEGREAIAYAKSCAALRDSFGGTRKWSDSDERLAIKAAMVARDRHRTMIAAADAARPALAAAETAALQSVRDTIRANRNNG